MTTSKAVDRAVEAFFIKQLADAAKNQKIVLDDDVVLSVKVVSKPNTERVLEIKLIVPTVPADRHPDESVEYWEERLRAFHDSHRMSAHEVAGRIGLPTKGEYIQDDVPERYKIVVPAQVLANEMHVEHRLETAKRAAATKAAKELSAPSAGAIRWH